MNKPTKPIFKNVVTIKNIIVDQQRQVFTVTATHSLCQRGELAIQILNQALEEPNETTVTKVESTDDEKRPALISPPAPRNIYGHLLFKVETSSEPIACPLIYPYIVTVKKQFSFNEVGLGWATSLKLTDAIKKYIP